jgi:hypothetical protein
MYLLLRLMFSSQMTIFSIFVLALWWSCSHRHKLIGFQISWNWADEGYFRNVTWWRLFQKRVVRTIFDIYVFMKSTLVIRYIIYRYLANVLSVLFRYMDSDYPFSIFKLFLQFLNHVIIIKTKVLFPQA